jgi:hypothetical protein
MELVCRDSVKNGSQVGLKTAIQSVDLDELRLFGLMMLWEGF